MGGINNYAQRCALFHDMGDGGDKYLVIKRVDHHGELNRYRTGHSFKMLTFC